MANTIREAAEADLWSAHRVPALRGARAAQTGHWGGLYCGARSEMSKQRLEGVDGELECLLSLIWCCQHSRLLLLLWGTHLPPPSSYLTLHLTSQAGCGAGACILPMLPQLA